MHPKCPQSQMQRGRKFSTSEAARKVFEKSKYELNTVTKELFSEPERTKLMEHDR